MRIPESDLIVAVLENQGFQILNLTKIT